MFQRMIDDFKASSGMALRQVTLAASAAIALFITTSFLCAALFIEVLDRYGPVLACLAGAALFFVVTLIAAMCYWWRNREIEQRAAERAKTATHSLLGDPMMLATGIQLARVIGVKRLIPILAVGGLAFGLLAGRSHAGDQTPAE